MKLRSDVMILPVSNNALSSSGLDIILTLLNNELTTLIMGIILVPELFSFGTLSVSAGW